MIFVTVGTHEQPFNRLICEIDKLKCEGIITEKVIIQTGYSTYKPKHCNWSKLYSYKEMQKLIKEARIVITHGGPSSFIAPLQLKKIPIVVPRQKKYNEHVNDHQLDFVKKVNQRYSNLIVIEDISKLGDAIIDYDNIVSKLSVNIDSNNEKFCKNFEEEAIRLVKGKK